MKKINPVKKNVVTRPHSAVQVLKSGKRRIVGDTKFSKDGCGY